MPVQDLKDAFPNGILPIYKLFFISNHDISLGDMKGIVNKKKSCINKLYAMKNKYTSHNVIPKNPHRVEANTVTHKLQTSPNPKQ